MAKLKKDFTFKNAEVNLEEGLIYEYDKNDEVVETYSLDAVLKELAVQDRLDLTINATTTLASSVEE